jgi:hypothetical protein
MNLQGAHDCAPASPVDPRRMVRLSLPVSALRESAATVFAAVPIY